MAFNKATAWIYLTSKPRLSFLEFGDPKDPSFKKVVHVQFSRYMLFEGASGAFQDELGEVKKAIDIAAKTGLKILYAGTSADRDFVCIQDETAQEVQFIDVVRRTQLWEMKKEPEDFTYPVPA